MIEQRDMQRFFAYTGMREYAATRQRQIPILPTNNSAPRINRLPYVWQPQEGYMWVGRAIKAER